MLECSDEKWGVKRALYATREIKESSVEVSNFAKRRIECWERSPAWKAEAWHLEKVVSVAVETLKSSALCTPIIRLIGFTFQYFNFILRFTAHR